MADSAVGIAFQGKDQVSPVVRGIRSTMDQLKKDAATGFGIGAGIGIWNEFKKTVGLVLDLANDAVNAWAAEEASITKLTTAIKENTTANSADIAQVEAVIAARERLAFADDDQRDSLARLVATTKDAEEAVRLQGIAMDFARLRGIDLSTASDIIGKVYSGNVGILSRYGVVLAKGTTVTEALVEVQARAQGQAEAYASTVQGRQLVSQIAMNNAMERVGEILAPVMLAFAQFAAGALTDVAAGLTNVAEAFHNVARWMSPHLALLEDTEKAIRMVAEERGLDADAAVAQFRTQNQVAAATTRLTEVNRLLANATDYAGNAVGAEAEALRREKAALEATISGTQVLTANQKTLTLSAEASAGAVAWLDKNLDALPKSVAVQVSTPGAAAAVANLQTILGIYGQLPTSLPRYSDPIPTTKRDGGKDGDPDTPRAMGGPAQSGRSYLVGERGPEVLTMGSQSGHITPNHRMGGGHGHDIYLDGKRVGRAVDRRLGDRWAMSGAGDQYRSA